KGLKTKTLIQEKEEVLLNKLSGNYFKHKEINYFDFRKEVLLPHKMSQLGPFISKGDVNNDGLEDFYISGASRQSGALYFQTQTGFELSTNQPWENNIKNEELGSVFIDFDNDDDLDLYVVNGSNEGLSEQDVLYINDGK